MASLFDNLFPNGFMGRSPYLPSQNGSFSYLPQQQPQQQGSNANTPYSNSYIQDPNNPGTYNAYGPFGGEGTTDYAYPRNNISNTGQTMLGFPILNNSNNQPTNQGTAPSYLPGDTSLRSMGGGNNNSMGAVSAHAIMDAQSHIASAYANAPAGGTGSTGGTGYAPQVASGGSDPFGNPFGTEQALLQNKWAAQNGLSPLEVSSMQQNTNAAIPAAYTPQEYNDQFMAEGNAIGNVESNFANQLAWNTLGGSGSSGNGNPSNPFSTSSTSGGGDDPTANYLAGASKAMQGVSATTPLSSLISTPQGQQAWLSAVYTGEGGTPQGTFNAGNIIITPKNQQWISSLGGTPGKAVPTQPGNYYANFPSQTAGDQATLAIAQNYLKNNPNMTLQQAAQKYTGYTPAATGADKANFIQQYGLIGTAPDFDPNNSIDTQALNYLRTFTQTGKEPAISPSASPIAYARFQTVQNMAYKLANEVGGMPSEASIQANQDAYNKSVGIVSQLNANESVVKNNFALQVQNMSANDLNGSNQVVNGIVNTYKNLMGDPAVAQAIAQNSTIVPELANVLGSRNASGTTVQNNLEAGTILNMGQTLQQKKAILNILGQEIDNVKTAYVNQQSDLYNKIDPLQLLANNPMKTMAINQYKSQDQAGNSGGNTWKSPSGNTYILPY